MKQRVADDVVDQDERDEDGDGVVIQGEKSKTFTATQTGESTGIFGARSGAHPVPQLVRMLCTKSWKIRRCTS